MPHRILPQITNQAQVEYLRHYYPAWSHRRGLRIGTTLENGFSDVIALRLAAMGPRKLVKWWEVEELNLPP